MPDVQDEEMEEELGEEEEDQQEKPKAERIEPETGPPLLTPLSEDTSTEIVPAWTVRSSSNIFDNFAIAVVRSNIWPGAYCFSTQGKYFQNIYIGIIEVSVFSSTNKEHFYFNLDICFIKIILVFFLFKGNGLKHLQQNYSPTPLPPVQQDYPIGPEIMEMTDPSGIDEERWRIDHLPKPKLLPGDEDEEEGVEEEEMEDEEEVED